MKNIAQLWLMVRAGFVLYPIIQKILDRKATTADVEAAITGLVQLAKESAPVAGILAMIEPVARYARAALPLAVQAGWLQEDVQVVNSISYVVTTVTDRMIKGGQAAQEKVAAMPDEQFFAAATAPETPSAPDLEPQLDLVPAKKSDLPDGVSVPDFSSWKF